MNKLTMVIVISTNDVLNKLVISFGGHDCDNIKLFGNEVNKNILENK